MVVDHSDRNIDTTFWGELFEVRLSAGSRRAEGRCFFFSLWVLEKSLKSPGIKPARWGVTESLVSKKLPSSSLSKQQECSVNFICFGFASVILKLQDSFPLNIVKKKKRTVTN